VEVADCLKAPASPKLVWKCKLPVTQLLIDKHLVLLAANQGPKQEWSAGAEGGMVSLSAMVSGWLDTISIMP